MAALSPRFFYGHVPLPETVWPFIACLVAAGAVYLVLFFWGRREPVLSRRTLLLAIAAGGIMRLLMFGTTPIYEDDSYRYLWDGAMVVRGIDPYAVPPARVGEAIGGISAQDAAAMADLARQFPSEHARINYPYVTTIYPPLAQAAFAAGHLISPFGLDGIRFVLFAADLVGLSVLLWALGAVGKAPVLALLYWWNPLVIITGFNAAHMDILLVPLLAGAVGLAASGRALAAMPALAGAVAIKVWPLVLAPVLAGSLLRRPKSLLVAAALVCSLSAVALWPLLRSVDPVTSGVAAYASGWERNALLFPLIADAAGMLPLDGNMVARFFIAGAVGGLSVLLGILRAVRPLPIGACALAVTGTLFFLSPTGYPWYGIWLFALLPFAPSLGIAALTVTLPIYYTRFYLGTVDAAQIFQSLLVPIEFGIPLLLLGWEASRVRRS